MKTVDLGNTHQEVAKLLDEARDDDVVLRLADGSEFLLIAIDEFDHEVARSRGNSRLMALLEDRAKQKSAISLNEVKRRLQI